ncbi:hypothetical protein B0H19DRAFT_1085433 [Mycena capillaripes]|nr:hypothetical protein B0H19DRAFT_1085433 [Mycena capillaripes]
MNRRAKCLVFGINDKISAIVSQPKSRTERKRHSMEQKSLTRGTLGSKRNHRKEEMSRRLGMAGNNASSVSSSRQVNSSFTQALREAFAQLAACGRLHELETAAIANGTGHAVAADATAGSGDAPRGHGNGKRKELFFQRIRIRPDFSSSAGAGTVMEVLAELGEQRWGRIRLQCSMEEPPEPLQSGFGASRGLERRQSLLTPSKAAPELLLVGKSPPEGSEDSEGS